MECHGIPSHDKPWRNTGNTSQAAPTSFVFAENRFNHGIRRSARWRERAQLTNGVNREDVGRDGGQDAIWRFHDQQNRWILLVNGWLMDGYSPVIW